jgi:ABC-type sulfate transport system permease component
VTERLPRRVRLAVVGGLLGAHLVMYLTFWALGQVDPLHFLRELLGGSVEENGFFQLLLLGANAIVAWILLRSERDLLLGAGIMFLLAAHGLLGHRLAPDSLTSGALLMVSVMVLYVGVKVNTLMPARYWWALVASYFALFFIFVQIKWAALIPGLELTTGMANAVPLLLLFLLGLAACARSMRLLAYFWAIVLGFTFCQPYAWEAMLVAFCVLTAVFTARGRVPSPTAVIFLACGLSLTFLVLFPVVTIVMGESFLSMDRVLRDADFLRALRTTLWTATLSTAILAVFTVPLAYAVSRLRFRGRALILSLIDLPIVIPQSVAAVALLRAFGEQQYLGQVLYDTIGVKFSGTAWGICLAQVFVAMPFIARTSVAAFDAVPEGLELAARTLGASSWGAFWRVALPLASRGVFLGAVLAWARAAGEFGALMLIAQNPRTAPMEVYYRYDSVGEVQAAPMGAVLLLFSVAMFFLLQLVSRMLPSAHGERDGEARR